ncbi:hypothetical protein LL668_09055 [Providencia rettgeri]|uniref:phage tail fiber protein n=1 Tax=Providencia rettgeri TaxID=587 RepID=UPI001E43D295|nr:hypothetical protein [Providencia rettgeri]UEK61253.1 hypothetical protein LL668_09055 [Providencia rettgeri]
MIYEIGTISTKANDPKITGKNTLWKNSVTKVSVGQIILIQSGNTIYQNSIRSVESDTQMTLSFPVPVALTDVKYVISITMIGSVSDGVNKSTSMVTESYQLMMILNRLMTESGVIKVVLPDGTEMQLRTEKERDRLLDGKLDKAGGTLSNHLSVIGRVYTRSNATTNANEISIDALNTSGNCINSKRGTDPVTTHYLPTTTGTLMQVGDYGIGSQSLYANIDNTRPYITGFRTFDASLTNTINKNLIGVTLSWAANGAGRANKVFACEGGNAAYPNWYSLSYTSNEAVPFTQMFYTTANTTKDSNGNLKAASPIIKVFADHIELNDESEGVEMEYLGIGHYLIKGVVGFNADGAWGINNGFVIPQDYNGKNMVLIDYEVRPDGDIEVFVFHQQNADMPERFQNKRIKHFDEEGVPVYFENYEPCDVPESRWIDMRVEMPPNSLYNQKQAEAERLAKLEAERLAQEEAKRAAEEAERAEQEAAEQVEQQ